MIVRAGSGWQTVLADLSLILFMTTAAALGEAPVQSPPAAPPSHANLPALAQPVAVWTAGQGAPPLAEWLRQSGSDPRLQLTILAPQSAATAALALAAAAGRPARLVLEPGAGPVQAMLGYDQAGLARSLQRDGPNLPRIAAR